MFYYLLLIYYVNCFPELEQASQPIRECLKQNAYQMLKATSHSKQYVK